MNRFFKRISEGLGETPRGGSGESCGRDGSGGSSGSSGSGGSDGSGGSSGKGGSSGIAPDSFTRQLPTTPKGE